MIIYTWCNKKFKRTKNQTANKKIPEAFDYEN